MTDEPLDLEVLNESAEFGIDGLRELLDEYFVQADEIIAGLRTAIHDQQPNVVNQLAHKLAGSSAVCGLKAVVEPLRILEQRGRAGELSDAPQCMDTLIAQLDLCHRLLDDYMATKGG
jgi:HPt (histidine-containing phosphotransfer) domain-containing protein